MEPNIVIEIILFSTKNDESNSSDWPIPFHKELMNKEVRLYLKFMIIPL